MVMIFEAYSPMMDEYFAVYSNSKHFIACQEHL